MLDFEAGTIIVFFRSCFGSQLLANLAAGLLAPEKDLSTFLLILEMNALLRLAYLGRSTDLFIMFQVVSELLAEIELLLRVFCSLY